MKNRLLCFLLMLTFIQVQSQDTDIIEQLSDFDCEENFFITRNPLPSNVAIGNINGSQLNMECAVPENAQGFNQFTANIYDLDFVQAVNNAPGGACWGIEWEVTGGTIYLSSGGGGWLPEAGSTVCFTAGPNTSLDCNTMCGGGGGTVDATVANNGYIHSTIRVKWDSNLQDSNVKYGVKAKLFIKAKNKFDFYLIEPKEQGSGDAPPPTSTPLGIKVKVSYSAEVKYQACEKFVEFGANSRLITNANSSALSCSNGGSRTITVNLTDEINRYPTCQIPAPFTINWQQRLGNSGSYQTIATSNSNNIGSNNSISYTFNNLSLTGAHSIRVLTKYGNMVAEERVFDYEPDGSVSGPVAVSVGQ
ncbi:hypothetical protein [Lewinella sp. LCG006]|uniref:hypothetical protein n=1 Tax=Lewinella sp. LCG006 TaxID=3231911 RepID=UPI0034603D2E